MAQLLASPKATWNLSDDQLSGSCSFIKEEEKHLLEQLNE